MAIVIRGKTRCRLCGRVIEVGDDIVMFPSGLFDVNEVAFEVNDAGVHRECLAKQTYAHDALERLSLYIAQATRSR
jgi:hypothetical protein